MKQYKLLVKHETRIQTWVRQRYACYVYVLKNKLIYSQCIMVIFKPNLIADIAWGMDHWKYVKVYSCNTKTLCMIRVVIVNF